MQLKLKSIEFISASIDISQLFINKTLPLSKKLHFY